MKSNILMYFFWILIVVILIFNAYAIYTVFIVNPEGFNESKLQLSNLSLKFDLPQIYAINMSPSYRLNKDPNIIAACQYEYWKNTTQKIPVATIDSIIYEQKSDVNWVCYYRDNHTTVQRIGAFTDTIAASNYIWYYYENGQEYPLIYTKNA